YREPLHVLRGEGAVIHTSDGRSYLDFYNNVASVGHAHPRVAEAAAAQMDRINSHSRYLYDIVEDYAERLLATFPDPLSEVAFTCTGSESNDLALRIARIFTGAQGVIVTRAAYHGNTAAVTDVSPSSWKQGRVPEYVRVIDPPDPRIYGEDPGPGFAAAVTGAIADLERDGHGFAALLIDTIFSSDGVFADPPGLLQAAAQAVRDAGGLLIADEVQPGFGRTGDAMWGFQRHGIAPDIVTLGKPMGNGYPLSGVITRPGLKEPLIERFGYFNTFGGTAVAAAAGNAVLSVIAEEGLQENARRLGTLLRAGFADLSQRHEEITAVRGAGLYLGVEIGTPAGTATQANDDPASHIVNGLRDRGILIGIAGAGGNVLKIRPPLCITEGDTARLIETMDEVLRG
ncbi:MAG TPA: aminotransferase class III-fold pyridoxal phosphate-dependent enzyme, partial [Paenirhodobacter sp.]